MAGRAVLSVAAAAVVATAWPSLVARSNPFALLPPPIRLSDADLQQLDRRDIIVRLLPARGRELAVAAAGAINADAKALASSVDRIAELKKNQHVRQLHRFSPSPTIDDVRDLTLDDADIEDIHGCRPGDCDLKLSDQEIATLQRAAADRPNDRRVALTDAFRRLLVERAAQYLKSGARPGQEKLPILLQHSPYLQTRAPRLAAYLERYPAAPLPGVESFLYWSKEEYAWKPIIFITQMTIVPAQDGEEPELTVTSCDVFSSRYTSGSLSVSLLLQDRTEPSARYLLYVNRTWVDAVRWLWRPFFERRVRGEARNVFAAVRERIEHHGDAAKSGTR